MVRENAELAVPVEGKEKKIKSKKKKTLAKDEDDFQELQNLIEEKQTEVDLKSKKKKKKMKEKEVNDEMDRNEESIKSSDKKVKKKKRAKESAEVEVPVKKAKFKMSLEEMESNQDQSPPVKPILNKGKGPKIVIVENSDSQEKEKISRRKRKAIAGAEARVHETKGMNKALDYLKTWQNDRASWKFEKCRQIWLLHNAYDIKRMNEENFSVLLEYIDSIKGAMRGVTLDAAKKKLSTEEEWKVRDDTELTESDKASTLGERPTEAVLKRARKIIRLLEGGGTDDTKGSDSSSSSLESDRESD